MHYRHRAGIFSKSKRRVSAPITFGDASFQLTTAAERDDYFDHGVTAIPPAAWVAAAVCAADATLIDVGANLGLCAIPFALTAPSGRVVAVEPGARAAADLRSSIALNKISNITVVECALGAEPGTATLLDPTWNASGAFISHAGNTASELHEKNRDVAVVNVAVETIDGLVERLGLQRVDFVKIDVEGYETAVLAGAQRTLNQHRPICVIEYNPFTISVMASQNPLHFLTAMQAQFPYVYAIDAALSVELIAGPDAAYGIANRCYSSGQICDLICSWSELADTFGKRRPVFSS